jgi:hypothetical protein
VEHEIIGGLFAAYVMAGFLLPPILAAIAEKSGRDSITATMVFGDALLFLPGLLTWPIWVPLEIAEIFATDKEKRFFAGLRERRSREKAARARIQSALP